MSNQPAEPLKKYAIFFVSLLALSGIYNVWLIGRDQKLFNPNQPAQLK